MNTDYATERTESSIRYVDAPHFVGPVMRAWHALPDWTFRAVGVLYFLGLLLLRMPDYFTHFWDLGPYYQFADGYRLSLPWTRVLVDVTCLLLGLSYLFRLPPRKRVQRASDVVIGMLGGFWPALPFILGGLLGCVDTELAARWNAFLLRDSLTLPLLLIGAGLVMAGNALDVWSYSTLFRSFSIVPEARELKVTGAYRVVRHPIYLGQIVAQAGIWLFFASFNAVSLLMLVGFIAIQLYRSKREDTVLEEAFGERYRQWRCRTFWFV